MPQRDRHRRRVELRRRRAQALVGDTAADRRGHPHRARTDAGVRARHVHRPPGRLDRRGTCATCPTPTTRADSPWDASARSRKAWSRSSSGSRPCCSSAVASRSRMSANAERRATRQIAVALAVTTAVRTRARGGVRARRPDPARRRAARVGTGRTGLRVRRDGAQAPPPGTVHRGTRAAGVEPGRHRRLRERLRPSVRGRGRHRQRARRRRFLFRMFGAAAARSGSRRCFPSPRSGPVPATRCSSRSGARGRGSSTSRASW